MPAILEYHEGNTILHKANPLTKIFIAIAICAAVFLSSNLYLSIALILLSVAIGAATGLARLVRLLILGLAGLGIVMFVVQTIIIRDGQTIFLFMTDEGIRRGIKVVLRIVGFALPLIIMLSLTKITDLTNAAVQKLHIPYKFAFTITTAIKFIPIFAHEMKMITEAQTARGVEFDTPNPFRKLKLMLPLMAPLLISSVSKADDAALAAEQRGFYLRDDKSAFKQYPFKALDFALMGVSLLLPIIAFIL